MYFFNGSLIIEFTLYLQEIAEICKFYSDVLYCTNIK